MAGPIRIAIIGNGRQARAEAGQTARAYGLMGRQISRTGKVVAGAFAVGSLVRLAAAAGKTGATYVSSLNKIQALTGSTDRQMGRLSQRIEAQSAQFARYGQTTGDAAAGMVELTKSGLSAEKALGAIRGTMTLAKAGELEVADASSLVANTLNTFSLKASQASEIANGLANAANISSADVTDLAESFKYAAPLAAKAGLSLAQTNAILAELSNQGVKASQAGTSLRGILLSLQAPSTAGGVWLQELGVKVYGANGKMRDFGTVMEDLRKSLGKLSQEDQNFALKSIFGRNSITGAQIILKNGKKGLDEYTKGVKRAGAAEKLAASASKGLAGTLLSVKAEATSTVQELYRRFSPALDARLQSVAGYLAENKGEMVDTAVAAGRRLGPSLASLARLAKSAGDSLADTAVPIAKDLLPAVETLADLAGDAAGALDDLPGPVKEIGVQAGVAALILPRLTAGVTSVTSSVTLNIARLQQWRAEMTYAETRSQQTAAMMQRLGAAARAAAGVGGLVALTQASQQTNQGLQDLLSVGGGALLGFSVGGPIGAAVGGVAGALLAVAKAGDTASDSLQFAKPKAESFATSLNKVSGAATRAANDVARLSLQQSGAFEAGRRLGISSNDLVRATLGQEGAANRVERAITKAERAQVRWANSLGVTPGYLNQNATDLGVLKNAIGATTAQYEKDRDAARQAALANGEFGRALKGIQGQTRRAIVSRIDLKGWPEGERQIGRTLNGLVRIQDKKSIRTVLRTLGAKESVADIQRVLRELRRADRARGRAKVEVDTKGAKANLNGWQRQLLGALTSGKRSAVRGGNDVRRGVEDGPRRARANLAPFTSSVRSGVGPAKGAATAGGTQVGANLKSGIFSGFAGTAAALAAEAASAVRQAVAAAKRAGEIHSPSRLMDREVGKPLAQGLLGGFTRQVTKGSDGIAKVLDRLKSLIEKRLDGKKLADRRKALLHSLKAEGAALRANGKLQDANTRKLDSALKRYNKVKDFVDNIRQGFRDYGSIVGLGTTGGGTAVTLPALLSQLAARAGVADQFSKLIDQLKGKLNKTSLRQLLDQAAQGDLEGALATAQAIAGGGAAAVAQINALTTQINNAGKNLGTRVSGQFFDGGLAAAEAVVKGLQQRQKRLDRIADRLADRLVKRIEGRLGIGKTSQPANRVSAADTHAKRTPALDAYMRQATAPTPAPATIRVRLTAEEVSQLQRGREIQADLDVYRAAGGRAKVKTP